LSRFRTARPETPSTTSVPRLSHVLPKHSGYSRLSLNSENPPEREADAEHAKAGKPVDSREAEIEP
jgi:hypothetical protein